MNNNQIDAVRARLLDLAQDRQSFFHDDGDDEIFRDDYESLMKAAVLLGEIGDLKRELADWRCKFAGVFDECRKHRDRARSYKGRAEKAEARLAEIPELEEKFKSAIARVTAYKSDQVVKYQKLYDESQRRLGECLAAYKSVVLGKVTQNDC